MGKKSRKELVRIGEQLGTLTATDKSYIMNFQNSESDVVRRMTTARQRKIVRDMAA
jgi:hypothetical protein